MAAAVGTLMLTVPRVSAGVAEASAKRFQALGAFILGCCPSPDLSPPLKSQELTAPTSRRLRMVETLSNLLRSVVALSPPDLLPILYLSLNRLGPPQQGLELGVGDGVLLKAVAQATGAKGSVGRCGEVTDRLWRATCWADWGEFHGSGSG